MFQPQEPSSAIYTTNSTETNMTILYIGRAGGAGLVAQAMAGPIFETFQDFSSGHMLVQAGNMRACHLQAKCRQCQTNVA